MIKTTIKSPMVLFTEQLFDVLNTKGINGLVHDKAISNKYYRDLMSRMGLDVFANLETWNISALRDFIGSIRTVNGCEWENVLLCLGHIVQNLLTEESSEITGTELESQRRPMRIIKFELSIE